MQLVLASRSRARRDLLRDAGYRVTVCAADLDESALGLTLPFTRRLRHLAECKALAVAGRFPNDYIVGADTALMFGRDWLGKPEDLTAACRLLERLAGRRHRVGSAVCVIAPQPPDGSGERRLSSAVDTAWVTLRPWDPARVRRHVRQVRPLACAGGYALQGGIGSPAMIARIEGDPATVIGLPLGVLDRILKVSRG